MSAKRKGVKKRLSEQEIDEIVTTQANDESAWEEPVYVSNVKHISLIPTDVGRLKARRAIFWEGYREVFSNYLMAISQIEVLILVSREATKDFPKNLPQELRSPLAEALREMGSALMEVATAAREGKKVAKSIKLPKDPIKSKLVESAFSLFFAQTKPTTLHETSKTFEVGFEKVLSSQALIMVFAHIEGFMADTLRVVCTVRPDVLKSEKKVDWATALAFDKKEDLISYLTERYVFEFGWQNLPKRLELLKKDTGLEIEYPQSELELIAMAENIRHVIVHNAGRVNQAYIEKTGRTDLAVGDLVPVTLEYIYQLSNAARMLASDLFFAVSKKFFDIEDKKLVGTLRRKKSSK